MMKYAIIYASRTGNTKILAEVIPTVFGQKSCVYIGGPGQEIHADVLFLGSWTDKGCFHNSIIDDMKSQENKHVILFGTAGFGQSDEYFEGIIQRTKEQLPASTKVLGYFMCQGRMPDTVKKRYEMDPQNPMYDQLIRNFDEALTHPDERDLARFTAFLNEGRKKWL